MLSWKNGYAYQRLRERFAAEVLDVIVDALAELIEVPPAPAPGLVEPEEEPVQWEIALG
jgi:hypothetical protein